MPHARHGDGGHNQPNDSGDHHLNGCSCWAAPSRHTGRCPTSPSRMLLPSRTLYSTMRSCTPTAAQHVHTQLHSASNHNWLLIYDMHTPAVGSAGPTHAAQRCAPQTQFNAPHSRHLALPNASTRLHVLHDPSTAKHRMRALAPLAAPSRPPGRCQRHRNRTP